MEIIVKAGKLWMYQVIKLEHFILFCPFQVAEKGIAAKKVHMKPENVEKKKSAIIKLNEYVIILLKNQLKPLVFSFCYNFMCYITMKICKNYIFSFNTCFIACVKKLSAMTNFR